MKCIFTFASGSEVYSLAMTNNTVYGGCFDHKIRVWNLNTMQKSHMLIGHEGVVRSLTIRHSTLYSGGSDTKLKVRGPSPRTASPPRLASSPHLTFSPHLASPHLNSPHLPPPTSPLSGVGPQVQLVHHPLRPHLLRARHRGGRGGADALLGRRRQEDQDLAGEIERSRRSALHACRSSAR